MKKIVIIQEPSLLREGIINLFHSIIHNATISTYASSQHHTIYEQENPGDLLFIDVQMDIDVMKAIKFSKNRHMKIIVWVSKKSDELLLKLFPEGLDGYFFTEMETNEFITGMLTIIEGKRYVHPVFSAILFDDYISRINGTVMKPDSLLTNREWEILGLLTKGFSNEEASRYLDISIRTVKNHVSSILKKLNVSSRTNAVSKALKKRWFN